jgi:chorismate dehydratase
MSVAATSAPPVRVGVVSYLNTLPLIDGLDRLEGIELRPSVPSLLIDQLLSSEVDLALCSSIDCQKCETPVLIVPAGMLGCRGPTLTVRLYSTRPISDSSVIHVDTDSHTSIVLMQVLLRELYSSTPTVIPYGAREHVAASKPLEWPDAMLLIGDKVVTDSPPAVRYPHQMDLGAAWFDLTGLPFVFAVWMARMETDRSRLRTAARVLDRQRRYNRERLEGIIHRRAIPRGWPRDLALTYLSERLLFEFTDECRRGMDAYFDLAHRHGLITHRRAVEMLEF